MAFSVVNKISEYDACSILMKEKQEVCIVNVGEIKPSKDKNKPNQYYCFVDYTLNDGTQFGISYSFYLEDGLFKCGTSSKLYHLMKNLVDLNPLTAKTLTFRKTDIAESLLNKKFMASAIVQSIGAENYPYVVLEKVIAND